MKLENKICLVTGGSSGIGESIATRLAKEGSDIIIADKNIEMGKKVCKNINSSGRNSIIERVDVTKEDDIERIIRKIIKDYGRLDIAINNAGVSSMNKVVDLTESDWDFNMDINAKGIFLCCKHEARLMIIQGFGKIINTASMAGKRGIPFLAHYCASKYAVIGFTKALAYELAPYKINVNCVCRGLVKTNMQERELIWEAKLKGVKIEKIKQDYLDMTPLGRMERPEDVAKLVLFLASSDSDFITGQAINVTVGIEMN